MQVDGEQVYRGAARTRKRCPRCARMVEIGAPAVFRRFSRERWGWQRGGFIGASKNAPTTHAYHDACALEAPELAGRVPPVAGASPRVEPRAEREPTLEDREAQAAYADLWHR